MVERRHVAALVLAAAIGWTGCGWGLPEVSLGRVSGTACLRPILATAVAVGGDLMLTVAHAIAGAEDDLRVITLDGAERHVSVVGFDPLLDLALLDVEGLAAPAVTFGDAEKGETGVIIAVAADLAVVSIDYRVRQEVIARSGDIYDQGEVLRPALELEAVIDPGHSGAPLMDPSGAMVGMVFARSTEETGQAWALQAGEIEEFLASVEVGTEVDRGRCR